MLILTTLLHVVAVAGVEEVSAVDFLAEGTWRRSRPQDKWNVVGIGSDVCNVSL